MATFAEDTLERATLDWLRQLGCRLLFGPDLAPDQPGAKRSSFSETLLPDLLRQQLIRLNPNVDSAALEEALRRITVPDHVSSIANNRALHRIQSEGIAVESRRDDGSIGAEIVRVIDFDNP